MSHTGIQALQIGHMESIVDLSRNDPERLRETGYPKMSLSQSKHLLLRLPHGRIVEVCNASDDEFRVCMRRYIGQMRPGVVRDELCSVLAGPMDTYARWWLLLEVTRLVQVNVFVEDATP